MAGGGRRDTGSGEDTGDGGRAGANVGAGGGQDVRGDFSEAIIGSQGVEDSLNTLYSPSQRWRG